jgi:N4-(beta-N-acetylglucosaminyl)-L-asparaginase
MIGERDLMNESVSRRGIMGLATSAVLAAGTGRALAMDAADPVMVVSTWDFGKAANDAALGRLHAGGSALDAVEAGAKVPEADPTNHSVGYGGYPDRDGHVTLDAIIMDEDGGVGAVAALEDVVHAISVARLVMEKTPHTLLVGEGATRFALAQGMPRTKLLTPEAETAWRNWLKTARYQPVANIENQHDLPGPPGSRLNHDTIGIMARAQGGHMAAACTTSGMAFKMRGRVGDSPQAGCGLFIEKRIGAAVSSGMGEEVTRIAGTARVIGSMRGGLSAQAACEEAVRHIAHLRGDAIKGVQVGFLALGADGSVGAYALMPGFTYAVTRLSGRSDVLPSRSLFSA